MGKYQKLVIIAGIVVFLDQITKIAIIKMITQYHSISVIPGLFNLTHVYNPGGAFGFAANQSATVRIILFLVVSTFALGFILYFYVNTPETHPMLAAGFSLIFGGAIGNLVDRIRLGAVVDFLDIHIKGMHWPAFNVADSAISIGMVIFIFHILFKKMPE